MNDKYRDWDHVYLEKANERIAELEEEVNTVSRWHEEKIERIAELEAENAELSRRNLMGAQLLAQYRAAIRDAPHAPDCKAVKGQSFAVGKHRLIFHDVRHCDCWKREVLGDA